MPRDFLKELEKRPIVFDGATGTMLQQLGLKPGGCPDELNLKEPSIVKAVHSAYQKAGSDVVTTNTFGANRIKLKEYGLEDRTSEINIQAGQIARDACPGLFAAGCMGPTGRFIEPVGELSFDEALGVFTEQADALKQGGVHLIIIETMMDIKEMRAAIIGARSTGLPVIATMTFDETFRTVTGTSPETFAITAASLGADVIGANCSLGIEGILRIVSRMQVLSVLPLIAQPNAGIPLIKDNETVFPATADEMSAYVPRLSEAGVRVLGGCCGTTPQHIKKMGSVFRRLKPAVSKTVSNPTALASRSSCTLFGAGLAPIIIGERINPTGRKRLAEEIREGKTSMIRQEARSQEAAGAKALDVNVGVTGIDEPLAMKRAIFSIN
ncbi:MAG: homocysteine S-methyltransferase family protein, partial [Deltaproteobacteria bacterium]|nr:homocysteine S-methyltransferase family protein [Deltaproteobacteria bacterium]